MGGVILIASMLIWALGYFPRNSKQAEKFNQKIVDTELKYDNTLSSLPKDSEAFVKISKEKKTAIEQLHTEKYNFLQENSFIGIIGKFIEPVMRPLGFDWKMSVSLLAGVAAKEVVVSTMGVLYQVKDNSSNLNESLQSKLQSVTYTDGDKAGQKIFNPVVAFSYLMFVLLYFPCVAVVAAVKKESGNWKWALFIISYTTAIAWLIAFLVNQIGNILF
jgi:ferrous iron transport protein B